MAYNQTSNKSRSSDPVLRSSSGSSYNTQTGVRSNPNGTTTQVRSAAEARVGAGGPQFMSSGGINTRINPGDAGYVSLGSDGKAYEQGQSIPAPKPNFNITPLGLTPPIVTKLPGQNNLTAANFNSMTATTAQGTVIPPTETRTETTALDDLMKSLQNNFDNIPSGTDLFNKAQKESGILQAQQNVGNLTGQLNQIVATGQANQLAVTGQGRGIPSSIIGGQQAEMARETAIQALPVSAQLAAAQGNLEMAQSNVNTLFSIYSKDAENKKNFYNSQAMAIYGDASKKEQAILDANMKQKDREYAQKQSTLQASNEMIINAFSQGAPGSITNKALEMVKNGGSAVDVAKALGVYSGDYLGNEAKRASIRSSNASANNSNASAAKNRAEQKLVGTASGVKQEDIAKAIESKTGQKTLATKGLVTELENLKGLYDKYGARPKSPEGIGAIQSARASAQLAITAAFGQGAISEGDRSSYEKLTGSTFSSSPTANLNQAISTQKKNYATNIATLDAAYPGIKNLPILGSGSITPEAPTINGVAPSGNTWSIPSARGKINNGQGVTTSGHSFTIIP
jgi:hypothetical protein